MGGEGWGINAYTISQGIDFIKKIVKKCVQLLLILISEQNNYMSSIQLHLIAKTLS